MACARALAVACARARRHGMHMWMYGRSHHARNGGCNTQSHLALAYATIAGVLAPVAVCMPLRASSVHALCMDVRAARGHVGARLGKIGVLGQEAVARVDGINPWRAGRGRRARGWGQQTHGGFMPRAAAITPD